MVRPKSEDNTSEECRVCLDANDSEIDADEEGKTEGVSEDSKDEEPDCQKEEESGGSFKKIRCPRNPHV